MRHRNAVLWLAASVCCAALYAAVQTGFSTGSFDGATAAWAATGDDELEPAKASAKSSGDKAKTEKSSDAKKSPEKAAPAAEKSDAKADEKPKGDRTGSEKNEKAAEKNKIEGLGDEKVGGADEGPAKKESFLVWLYKSLGTRYVIIFLIVTFNAVALIVMIVLGMRRSMICPDDLAAAFEAKLNEKQYQEAYELAKADRSFLGKVLAAGMARLSEGYEPAMESMQEVGEELNVKLEQRNGYIALIAQIGPMFGLLGTVDGMVMAFDVIAHSNVTPKPSELAQGIGTALVTTVVGLWIAIPSIAFYHIIRNRLTRMVLEVGTVSGNLMHRFATIQVPSKKS